jgi:taurine dioxygenase
MATAQKIDQAIAVTPLTGSIGAEVHGVDLSRDLSAHVEQSIREAFHRHFVLVFRNQGEAGPEEQRRLAALFGTPEPVPLMAFLGVEQAAISLKPGSKLAESDDATAPRATAPLRYAGLQNIGIAGEFDGWHSDSTFTPWFHRAAVLRCPIIPPVGGDTGFASLCAAYDGLSPMLQEWLAGLRAVHMMPEGLKEGINIGAYGPDAEARFDAAFPPREWPVVITHPESGRKALFVNPSDCVHIVGLKRAESHALLRFLCRHVVSSSFVYRHHWRPGDLVLWDELSVLHRAPDDFAPHDREVVRVTAGRVVPFVASEPTT